MITGFWWLSLLNVWQRRWQSSMAAIAVTVDGGGSGIEPIVLMVALLAVVVADGGGNNGIFTDASHHNDRHPCPHYPCPPSDEDRTVGWRARCDASHLSSAHSLSLEPSLSPLMGQRLQGRQPRQQTRL
jgi:hypothetical protein